MDAEGRVRLVNDAAEGWLGRSRARLLGQPLDQVEPWGASLARLANEAIAHGRSSRERLVQGARAFDVQAAAWWVGAQLDGAVLLVREADVAEQAQDVAALAAGLAHEVRNPLAALRGAAELLSAELGAAETNAQEYVALILKETARVDSLVARLLALARPISLQKKPVPMAAVVHELAVQARAFARARSVAVQIEERFDPALPPLEADRERLFEALVNLVKNAAEALPAEGGRLELEAGIDPERRQKSASGRSLPLLRLAVRDDGRGLGDAKERLFTPFFSTKSAGTGLGLLLARRTIEAHGGRLTLRDAPGGRGTEALVLLPFESSDG